MNSLQYDLTLKQHSMLRVLLDLKFQFPKNFFFYLVIVIFKFLGLFLLNANFSSDQTDSFSTKIENFLRSFTLFGIFANTLTFSSYLAFSLLIIIFLAANMYLLAKLYRITKFNKTHSDKYQTKLRRYYLSLMNIFSIILLIFNTHMLEFLSYIYTMYFNTISSKYDLFNYYNQKNGSSILMYFLITININSQKNIQQLYLKTLWLL